MLDGGVAPKLNAGACAGVSEGASKVGIEELGVPKVGVAPTLGRPNMPMDGGGMLPAAGCCGDPNIPAEF